MKIYLILQLWLLYTITGLTFLMATAAFFQNAEIFWKIVAVILFVLGLLFIRLTSKKIKKEIKEIEKTNLEMD